MTYPIIGVTTYQGKNEEGYPIVALQRAYIRFISQGRGCTGINSSKPCLRRPSSCLLNRLDGILFTGGGDIAIDRYGGEPHPMLQT